MDRYTLLGLAVIAGGFVALRPYFDRGGKPWPPYAAPMQPCADPLPKAFDNGSLHFAYPAGWKATEKPDAASKVTEVFLAPADGGADDVVLFLREGGAGAVAKLAHGPEISTPGAPGTPGASTTPAAPIARPKASAGWVPGTNQTFSLDGKRQAYGYLGRSVNGNGGSDSWMVFLWDPQGRMAAVSGPRLPDSLWPPKLAKNKALNCAFWEILRSVEPK